MLSLDITKVRGYDEQSHINKFENLGEKADITKIIREYSKQLINKFVKLDKMDKSCENTLPKWTQEKIEKLHI